MAKSSEKKISTNDNIIFGSNACDCEIDKIHPEKGVIKNIIRLYPKDYKHRYTYKNGKELVSIKADGTVIEKTVLADFLAIKDNKSIKNFIERHGYPFLFKPDKDTSLDSEILFSSIHRLDATVNLMAAIGEGGNDYEKILALTLELLLSPQPSIKLPDGEEQFLTYPHDMSQVWNGTYQPNRKIEDLKPNEEWKNVDTIKDIVVDIKPPAENHPNYRTYVNNLTPSKDRSPTSGDYIPDSIRAQNIWFDMNEYLSAENYLADYPSSMRAKTIILFRDAKNVGKHCRLAVDFLYNFCKDVGDIETWSRDGKLVFADNSQPVSQIFKEKLDEQLREGLLKLAKQTLKAEIEGNLVGIKPSYNTETMAPAWRIDYLLSGIYFSLFNIQAKDEQYRICARPNCGRYFLTKTDSTKQKYCSYNCSNATAQKVHRGKKAAIVNEEDVAIVE